MKDFIGDIDLTYRPRSYFWASDLGVNLASSIKGASRKRLYEQSIAEGEPAPPGLMQPKLSDKERNAWGWIHPQLMGGEYLPDRAGGEVEIARIAINSTTQDVTCVYVRKGKGRLFYRVVDEYGGDTLEQPSSRTSLQPLSLGGLTEFFLRAWNLKGCLGSNFDLGRDSPEDVHGFVLEASSDFYPEFGSLVRSRMDLWLQESAEREDE
ncbi:hypothetical protein [Ramlibacter tataouinensis]|nr:hypothetical protein [Ramlibacter tataouinensis]